MDEHSQQTHCPPPSPRATPYRIPASYRKVSWRCILPPDPDGSVGIGFNVLPEGPDGRFSEVIRVHLDCYGALHLGDALRDAVYAHLKEFHSHKSSGMPSSDVSTPAEMEHVCPPARSPAASSGCV